MSCCIDEEQRFEQIAKRARDLSLIIRDANGISKTDRCGLMFSLGYIVGLCNQSEETLRGGESSDYN
jgi:hypothetical protein